MTDREHDAERAHAALTRAVAPAPDDGDHPGWAAIEALACGTIADADREAVMSHLDGCARCAEDLADLEAVQAAIPAALVERMPRGQRRRAVMWWSGVAAALVLAAMAGARWMRSAPAPEGVRTAAPAGPGIQTPPPGALPPAAPALTPEEQQLVARALGTGRIELSPDARALIGETGTLLGSTDTGERFGPTAPAGTAILSARPTFVWRPMPGAVSYTVAVFDDRFAEVARSPRVRAAQWIPASDLPRGAGYTWQITAHAEAGDVVAPAPPRPEARFRILDGRSAAAVAEQQSRLASEPLALAVLLGRAGLLVEAAAALERAAARPADRASALTMLADLRAQGAPMTANPAQ